MQRSTPVVRLDESLVHRDQRGPIGCSQPRLDERHRIDVAGGRTVVPGGQGPAHGEAQGTPLHRVREGRQDGRDDGSRILHTRTLRPSRRIVSGTCGCALVTPHDHSWPRAGP